jgi:hypothetical protein
VRVELHFVVQLALQHGRQCQPPKLVRNGIVLAHDAANECGIDRQQARAIAKRRLERLGQLLVAAVVRRRHPSDQSHEQLIKTQTFAMAHVRGQHVTQRRTDTQPLQLLDIVVVVAQLRRFNEAQYKRSPWKENQQSRNGRRHTRRRTQTRASQQPSASDHRCATPAWRVARGDDIRQRVSEKRPHSEPRHPWEISFFLSQTSRDVRFDVVLRAG